MARKQTSTNYRNEQELILGCPLAAVMRLVGARWTMMVIWYIHHGLHRFAELSRTISIISDKVLHARLRELEANGLVARIATSRTDVRYALTPLAESLLPVLAQLASWSEANQIAGRLVTDATVAARAKAA